MKLILWKFLRDTPAVLGLAIVLFGLLVAIFANQLAPYPDAAFTSNLLQRFKPPSAEEQTPVAAEPLRRVVPAKGSPPSRVRSSGRRRAPRATRPTG